jgi:glycosyltransferase involved in cell wall biosynthesis
MQHKLGVKFLFDMRGFWADERVDGKLWNLSNPVYKIIYKYFKKKEKDYLRKADHIISLTHAGKKELLSWKLKEKDLPITVIPCCVDTELFNPKNISAEQQQNLRTELGLHADDFLIGYVGSIGTWYLLDEMLDYFKTVLKNHKATMLFVTNEPASLILNEAQKRIIPAERFIILSVPRNQVPLYISIMNYSLFFIKPSYSKTASSPTKQGELMAMGKPVVCNARVGDTEYVVKHFSSGIVVDDFNEENYWNAIQSIETINFDSEAIRKGAIEFYGLEKGIDLYASVYDQLTTNQ